METKELNTIWKYPLEITGVQEIAVPVQHEFLSVAVQNGELCVWIAVNSKDDRKMAREIHIFGTGNPLPSEVSLLHLGSAVMSPFVWHVFIEI